MTKKKKEKDILEASLVRTMQALDKQVSREIQRTPAETQKFGVQKWQPFEKRSERVAALILQAFGDDVISLDSLIILTRSMTNALRLVVEELGQEGLGEVRSRYCQDTMERAADEARRAIALLSSSQMLN